MTDERCDILVIGAGVAGGAFAAGVGRLGVGRVVLAERSAWPREKVCGCCLNAAGVQSLSRLGLGAELERKGQPLDRVILRACGGVATFTRRGGVAVSRRVLDGMLVDSAVRTGVEFRPATSATVEGRAACGGWHVRLQSGGRRTTISAGLVTVADGLGGGSLDGVEGLGVRVARDSLFGVGGVVQTPIARGVVEMNVGRHGYVGLVRAWNGEASMAAALDPAWTRKVGGPRFAVDAILREAGAAAVDLDAATLRGTPLLTRRRERAALPGLLAIGDSNGYVEPFTGEGMAWGLAGAEAAASMVGAGLRSSELAAAWSRWHADNVLPRQRMCTSVRSLLRRPTLVGATVRVMAAIPAAGQAVTRIADRIERPYSRWSMKNAVPA